MYDIQQYGYDVPGTSKKNTKGNTAFGIHQAVATPSSPLPDGQPRSLKRLKVEDGLSATFFRHFASPVASDASVEGILPKPKTQGQAEIHEHARQNVE